MGVEVSNEVEVLEEVVVHRPGLEIERMTPHDLERVLFDDILAPKETIREHSMMCEILEVAGARVLELRDLLIKALELAPRDAVDDLIALVLDLAAQPELAPFLRDRNCEALADALVHGVRWEDLSGAPQTLARIRNSLYDPGRPALAPVPNLMFMRDPCMAVFDSVVIGRMATIARARESLLVAFALRWARPGQAPKFVFENVERVQGPRLRSVEGGDVLVLSPEVLMIGCSERTSAETLQHLADDALFPAHSRLRSIYAVMLPEQRTVMHLDTILTQIDRELFLGHRPMIAGQHGRPGLPVARLTREAPPLLLDKACVLDVLREEFGPRVELHSCGGEDPLHQEREQWTDGANAVCFAPGHILLYSRNVETIRTLHERGFADVRLSLFHPPEQREAAVREGMKSARCVFGFTGAELSRARGGGRCLTMPLRRAHGPAD